MTYYNVGEMYQRTAKTITFTDNNVINTGDLLTVEDAWQTFVVLRKVTRVMPNGHVELADWTHRVSVGSLERNYERAKARAPKPNELIVITSAGVKERAGLRSHYFKRGDECRIKIILSDGTYYVERLSDGFWQVVDRGSFEIIEEAKAMSDDSAFLRQMAVELKESGVRRREASIEAFREGEEKAMERITEEELPAYITEADEKLAAMRKEFATEVFGEVADCHVWKVTYLMPATEWYAKIASKYGRKTYSEQRQVQVVTRNNNSVEATMAAEAIAKAAHEDAKVEAVKYDRPIKAFLG